MRAARLLAAGGLLAAACARTAVSYHASAAERAAVRDQIAAMMARSATNWNRGDLDAFDDRPGRLAGRGVVNVIARYVLARHVAGGRDSVTATGPTSLVMRRVGGRWRIVHDHSS